MARKKGEGRRGRNCNDIARNSVRKYVVSSPVFFSYARSNRGILCFKAIKRAYAIHTSVWPSVVN